MNPVDIEEGMKLARRIAGRFIRGRPWEQDDLIQVAYEGLVRAASRYDESYEVPFEQYAALTISGTLKHHLRDSRLIHMPRSIKDLIADLAKARKDTGKSSAEELAKEIGRDVEEVERALLAEKSEFTLGIDHLLPGQHDDQKTTLQEVIPDENDHYADVEIQLLIQSIDLTDEEREVLRLTFYEGKTQREIGQLMGRNQQKVHRLLQKSFKKIRSNLELQPEG